MRFKFTAVAVCASVWLTGSCSLVGLSEGDYLTDGRDEPSAGSVGVPAKVGQPMSYSLISVMATRSGQNPRITDVELDAEDGVELVDVGFLDSKASVGAITVDEFPPEPYFKEYPQDRDNFHHGLPSGPVPAKVPWSLVGAVVTHNEGPTTVRSVTVTYEIDGDSHHQEFDVLFNLCGYTDDPDDVECEAPDID